MAANSGDLEENLRINVNIHYRGILGILVKRIDTKGYLVRKVEDVSPFFTVLKIGDIITHWDKIPLHNVSFDKYNELVEVSQKNGKFALLLKRYTKQKPKDKNQETNNKDEAGETQTETAPVPAPNLPSSSGVTAAGKDGNDNAVLDKIEIVSNQTMLEDTPLIQHTTDKSNSTFNVHLEELKKFKKVHGHTNPNRKNDRALYNWCASIRFAHRSRQRGENKGIRLGEDRIHRLEQIGFLFDQETNNKDDQTETAPIPLPALDLPSPSGVTAADKDGNDNAVLDKIEIVSDQTMLEDTPLIQHTTDKISFYESLEELKQYKKQHGHVNVDEASNPKLYNWCVSMRSLRRFPKLQPPDAITSPETQPDNRGDGPAFNEYFIKELEELNFDWDPDKCDTHHILRREDKSNSTFNVHLEELKKFKKVHGHTNPNGKTDRALYSWCLSIVRSYKDMKRGEPPGLKLASKGMKLDEDRIRRLEEIGFSFVRKRKSALFDDNLHELKRYKSIHGHCNVTAKNDGRIGTWAANIRSLHRSKQRGGFSGMQLSEDRIDRLEEIGFLSDTESASNGCSQEQEEHSTHADTKAKHRLTPSQAATSKHAIIEESASPSNRHSRLKRKPVTYEEDFDDSSIDEVSGSKRRRSEWMSTRKTRNLRNTQEEKKGYEFFLNITKRTACEDEEGSAVTKWADLSIEEQTCYNELAYFEVKRLESKKSFDISGRGEKYPNFPSTEWSTLKTPALWDLPEDWKVEDGNVGLTFESPNGASFVSHKKAAMYAKRMKDKARKPINLSAEVYPLGTNIIKPAEQYLYKGKVSAITKNAIKPYHVIYNNGEEEDFTEDEIKEIICDKQSGEIAQEAEIEKLFPIAYEGKVVGIPSGRSTHYDVCLANNGQIERVQSGHLEEWVELHELHKNEGIMLCLANICEGPDNICPYCKKKFKHNTRLINHIEKVNCLQNNSSLTTSLKGLLRGNLLHRTEPNVCQKAEKPKSKKDYVCPSCSKAFVYKKSFEKHVENEECHHVCSMCQMAFNIKSDFDNHIKFNDCNMQCQSPSQLALRSARKVSSPLTALFQPKQSSSRNQDTNQATDSDKQNKVGRPSLKRTPSNQDTKQVADRATKIKRGRPSLGSSPSNQATMQATGNAKKMKRGRPRLGNISDHEVWKVEDGNAGLAFESPNGVSYKKAAMYAKRMKDKAGKNHPINLSAEVKQTNTKISNVYPLGTNIIKPAEQYLYKGKVSAITKNAIKPYHVIYNDGEEEDFTEDEIKEIICDKQSGEIAQEAEIEKLFPIAYEGKVVGIPSGRSTHYDVCLAYNGQIERVQSGHLEEWVELHELHKNEGIMLCLANICEGPDNICPYCKKKFKHNTRLINHIEKVNCLQNNSSLTTSSK